MSEIETITVSGREVLTSGLAFTFEKIGDIEIVLQASEGRDIRV